MQEVMRGLLAAVNIMQCPSSQRSAARYIGITRHHQFGFPPSHCMILYCENVIVLSRGFTLCCISVPAEPQMFCVFGEES